MTGYDFRFPVMPHRLRRLQVFDAVVVASGHYHACRIPDIPGLADLKKRWPSRVQHSKSYRHPRGFRDQVGAPELISDVDFVMGCTDLRNR